MPDRMTLFVQLGTWILFFFTSVYGHIAFKFVTGGESFSLWGTLFSFWGVTATLSWAASALLWIFILAKNPLLAASTISSLSYGLIVLAAVFLFKETFTARHLVGVLLVIAGIYFVTQ
jgi:undecaprenyl phosphate-alpha-L-ara4N flippase subunit ArnE